jgi:hypothetical protein
MAPAGSATVSRPTYFAEDPLDVLAEGTGADAVAAAAGEGDFFADDIGGEQVAHEGADGCLQTAAPEAEACLPLVGGEARRVRVG